MLIAAVVAGLTYGFLSSQPTFVSISAEQASHLLNSEEDTFILDVRTRSEYENDGHIPGANLIPHDEISHATERLPVNKTHTILVYCRSGRRSRSASRQLAKLGYLDVRNMKRGFNDWSTRGYPVVRGP